MMNLLPISNIVIAIFFVSHASYSCPIKNVGLECHKLVGNSLSYLSTKSPYLYEENNRDFTPEGCTPEKFWYYGRHGTRTPGVNEILYMQQELPLLLQKIILNYEENRGSLCPEELGNLKSWIPHPGLDVKEFRHLVEQGRKELKGIAKRYSTRFPNLFPRVFTNQSYYFQYNDNNRTKVTADAFASGIFGSEGVSTVWYAPTKKDDPVLKFYNYCAKWLKEVGNNPETKAERTLFQRSLYMNETVIRVSQRLGFLENLSLEVVELTYFTCAFETGWTGGRVISPWCAAFSEEDFRAISFWEDLDYYWVDGHGKSINSESACPPIKNLVEIFDELNSPRKVTGYFSHTAAILKVLARLGVFKDTSHLTASQYATQGIRREWNTTYIDQMATNMAFVLFNCPNKEHKQQIGFYFQEKPTKLPACGDQWICPYDEFKAYFSDILSNCNLEEICRVD